MCLKYKNDARLSMFMKSCNFKLFFVSSRIEKLHILPNPCQINWSSCFENENLQVIRGGGYLQIGTCKKIGLDYALLQNKHFQRMIV